MLFGWLSKRLLVETRMRRKRKPLPRQQRTLQKQWHQLIKK
jgi:hypothetical protein